MPRDKKQYQQEYYRNNKEKIKKKNREYYKANKEKIREQQKRYYDENKDRVSESHARYYSANREKVRAYQERYYRKYKDIIHTRRMSKLHSSPYERMIKNLRTRLSSFVRYKSKKTKELIGCDREHFMRHLEVQFKEGMTWDNYGEWVLDHHIPITAFNLENKKEFEACWHFSNIKPMWARDNMRKGNRICLER